MIRLALAVTLAAGCQQGAASDATATIDAWRSIGMTCAGPADDHVPSGLRQWSCVGLVKGTVVNSTLDARGDELFTILLQVPHEEAWEVASAALVEAVAHTPALGSARDPVGAWLAGARRESSSLDVEGLEIVLTVDANYDTVVVRFPD